MSTLITVLDSDGVRGRCDARCHNAALGTACRCICQGRFHSASHEPGGIDEAVQQYGEEVVATANRIAQANGEEIFVPPASILGQRIGGDGGLFEDGI